MNKVHATTQKIANSLNLHVSLEQGIHTLRNEEELTTICIEDTTDESDASGLVTYIVNPNGTYTYHSKCSYNASVENLEDLPAHIQDEKGLRQVIKYIGATIVASK